MTIDYRSLRGPLVGTMESFAAIARLAVFCGNAHAATRNARAAATMFFEPARRAERRREEEAFLNMNRRGCTFCGGIA